MTEYETSVFLWTKIAALGTCIGSLATFCAVCVALWQTKHINRKKLKLELSQITQLRGCTQKSPPYLTLTVSNIGNREVQIKSWIIKGRKKNGFIMPSQVYADGFSTLPVILKCEQQVMLMWEESMFIQAVDNFIHKGIIKPHKKITFHIIDSVGKTYVIKTKERAINYIK